MAKVQVREERTIVVYMQLPGESLEIEMTREDALATAVALRNAAEQIEAFLIMSPASIVNESLTSE